MISRRSVCHGIAGMFAVSAFPAMAKGVPSKVAPLLMHRGGHPVYSSAYGAAKLPYDFLAQFLPRTIGKTYYVDPLLWIEGNRGATRARPLRTIGDALAQPDVARVVCRGGLVYQYDARGPEGLGSYSGGRSVSIVAEGRPAIFATSRRVFWKPTDDGLFESSKTGGAVVQLVDVQPAGRFEHLKRADSHQGCIDTLGSWFYQDGRVLVNLAEHPGESLLVFRSIDQGVSSPGVNVHFQNLHFMGGSDGAFSDAGAVGSTLVFERCKFSHNWQADGLRARDAALTVSIECDAFANANDGFNYHRGAHLAPHFIEYKCRGYDNRSPGTGNGSSAHDDCVGMRFSCDYFDNNGPGIADVGRSRTWNAGCTSVRNGHHRNSYGVYVGGSSEVWLDGVAAQNTAGAAIAVADTARVHMRSVDGDIALSAEAIVDSVMT